MSKGRELARELGIEFKQALYSEWGNFYAPIKDYPLDPIRDLRPLCPNCHAIAHLRQDPYTIEEIQEMIMKHKRDG